MKVLDSDILIGILRNNEDAINKILELEDDDIGITIFSWQELLFGPAVTGNEEEFKSALELLNSYRHLNYEKEAVFHTVKILTQLKKTGKPIGVIDGMIAGVCLQYNAAIVTRNLEHFSRVPGLQVVSW